MRRRDAHRLCRGWIHRPGDEPRCPVRPAGRRARRDVRARVPLMRDIGFTPTRERASCAASGRSPPRRSSTAGGSGCEMDHARLTVHRRRRHLRVLRTAALPPRAARQPEAYGIAGLVAAIVAGAQILGGFAAPWIRGLFARRTSALFAATAASAVTLALIGVADRFWAVIALIVVWALLFAAQMPIHSAYLNGLIRPSSARRSCRSTR